MSSPQQQQQQESTSTSNTLLWLGVAGGAFTICNIAIAAVAIVLWVKIHRFLKANRRKQQATLTSFQNRPDSQLLGVDPELNAQSPARASHRDANTHNSGETTEPKHAARYLESAPDHRCGEQRVGPPGNHKKSGDSGEDTSTPPKAAPRRSWPKLPPDQRRISPGFPLLVEETRKVHVAGGVADDTAARPSRVAKGSVGLNVSALHVGGGAPSFSQRPVLPPIAGSEHTVNGPGSSSDASSSAITTVAHDVSADKPTPTELFGAAGEPRAKGAWET